VNLLLAYAAGVLTGVLAAVLTALVVARVLAPARAARSLVVQQAAEDVAAVREGTEGGEP
jgi:hypothetical protein